MGSSAGAVRVWKDIKRAQRLVQVGQRSTVECKGISQPDCISNSKKFRGESRA